MKAMYSYIPRPRQLVALWLAAALAILAGCATNPTEPYKAAELPEQKAFAIYGVFVIYEEQGAALVEDPRTLEPVKKAIKTVDAKAKPVVDAMLDSALLVMDVRSKLAKGETTVDKLVIASQNLEHWLNQAKPLVDSMVNIVNGGK